MKVLQSIRWRVQMWHSLLLGLLLVALGWLFYRHEREIFLREIDARLVRVLPMFPPRIEVSEREERAWPQDKASRNRGGPPGWMGGPPPRPGDGEGKPPERGRPPRPGEELHDKGRGQPPLHSGSLTLFRDQALSEEFADRKLYYGVWVDHWTSVRSDNAPADLEEIKNLNRQGGAALRTHSGNREAFTAIPRCSCIVVGMPLDEMKRDLATLRRRIAISAGGVWFGGMAIGWMLSGIAVRPFEEMRRTARKIAAGDLKARVPGKYDKGETGELATDLNHAFAALEASFEQHRRFTADASHELRSPISAMMSETQVALRRERDVESYKASLEVVDGNLRKMNALTNDLLNLARLDSGEMPIHRQQVDLAILTKSALDLLHGLIDEHRNQVITRLDPAPCEGDSEKLGQVVVNLVSNAVLHSPDGTMITVESGMDDGCPWLSVADRGPGIPADQIPFLFERFYRGDLARKHHHGSTGLGLEIARMIVAAHGGRIEVSSKVGEGSIFTVIFGAS